MLLPDYPIENKENDRLRRSPVAMKIAEMIDKFDGKESFVIGIDGPWGSGKTSFVNLILSELKLEDTIIISFNPWNFSGQNELITDFRKIAWDIDNDGNPTGQMDKSDSKRTHISDALGYYVWDRFRMRASAGGKQGIMQ